MQAGERKCVLVLLAEGFEEIEAVTVIDILRRAGVEVITAGIQTKEITGSRKIRLVADAMFEEVRAQEFDLVVLPGGQPGVDNLRRDPRVLEFLRIRDSQQKGIGAICAAPLVLKDAGIIAGKHLTSYPSVAKELVGSVYEESCVVCDGHLVTSQGPGTAMPFALKLVELLKGPEAALEQAAKLLASGWEKGMAYVQKDSYR